MTNPYRIAMAFYNYRFFLSLSPLTLDTAEAWANEVRSCAEDEPYLFLGDDDEGETLEFSEQDWNNAWLEASADVQRWFWECKNDPTVEMIEDAIEWLTDCDSDLEGIEDLKALLVIKGEQND